MKRTPKTPADKVGEFTAQQADQLKDLINRLNLAKRVSRDAMVRLALTADDMSDLADWIRHRSS